MHNSSFEQQLAAYGRLVYTNVGTSMRPLIRQGRDLMVISPKPEGRLHRYDVPLYRHDNGRYVLHRILKVREHDYVICGDNRYRREYGITDRHIIGVLTAVVRDGKEIPVTSRGYRAYVHLWCDCFWLRAALVFCAALPQKLRRKWKNRQKHAKQ